ncbi:MAG TPA: hypothetical protein VMF30_11200 [Pirellulales bacterium]|nr:hypothetical protein [Pirellulales bacterium]
MAIRRFAAGLVLSLVLSCTAAPAEELAAVGRETAPPAPAAEAAAEDAAVPLTRVVLFSSGVGFFDRQGEIDGSAAVALKFNTTDVNDLLKSLVVEDRGGGQISAVTYGSKDPITKTLKKFAIDLTGNPTLAAILNQIRGERIEFSAPGPLAGTLLGVEIRRRDAGQGKQPLEVEIMNVLTDDGLRSIPLDQVGAIRVANAQLDKEFRQALAVLASGHDADKKSVTLHFAGQGRRPVRVGYIQNAPIWKTSYRLVLDAKATGDEKKESDEKPGEAGRLQPLLQGWAIVENTTEEDWKNVRLSLVSGRPVSFIMNLYDPLYVQRPTVEPELFAGLRPQVYDAGDRDLLEPGLPAVRQNVGGKTAAKPTAGAMSGMGARGSGSAKGDRRAALADAESAGEPNLPVSGEALFGRNGYAQPQAKDAAFSVTRAADPGAQSGDVGELFQYSIVPPVTLARQESAMLPIVDEQISGRKLSVYNPAVQPKHPLSGLRLANTTQLHLMQGPITVFDGGAYAGDAQIEDIAPGAERLVTYAIDLDVECNQEANATSEEITSVRLVKGVLYSERKHVRSRKYKIKNSDERARTVLVEQPIVGGWNLVAPKEPTEKTRSVYRFAVDVEPKKSAALEVAEDNVVSQQIQLANSDDATIRFFLAQRVISAEVKAALEKIIAMKAALAALVEQQKHLESQLKSITDEQQRIRQNMQQLDRNSDLYKRYVKKFGEQEDTVEGLGNQVKRLADGETAQRKALDDFLLSLDLKPAPVAAERAPAQ